MDTGSIGDAAASGFVGGLSTISLRGFGSQSTLILINGRRVAPVAAVDINFGRGSLISVNTIPKGAIDRIDLLKDGASALYGSDAMAGVINYILRKDYQGAEGTASYSANDRGVGGQGTAGVTFGFGNLDTQRFNVFGGLEFSKRDSVMHSDLKDRGNQAAHDAFLIATGSLPRFTPNSTASLYGNYYRLPASLAGSSTTIDPPRSVANNNLSGANYLGTLPGCPAENTVGQGVATRPDGFIATTASLRTGQCRFNLDNADEAIAEQERLNATVRGTFAVTKDITAFADLMFSQTKTTETRAPTLLTTTLATTGNRTATTWPKIDGTFLRQDTIILPVGHPDNPTNGTSNAQPIQVIYRFEDLPLGDINTLKSLRFTAGFTGMWGDWDFDTAPLCSRQDNKREQEGRLRSSLLNAAIANGTYRFGRFNDAAGQAAVSGTAVNEGESTITSLDFRASRPLFAMGGGDAALAAGVELRREELSAVPDDVYGTGDYIGLVANGASGSRNLLAAFAELSLPVFKSLELQAALRAERYSDFGNATTGKLGFKWTAVPSMVAFRGTVATGFRAPSISQIGDSFVLSFNNFQERRVIDPLRCDPATFTTLGGLVNVPRDCNVLNFSAVPAGTTTPGNMPTVVSANKNLKPEKSRSFTFGLLLEPYKDMDLALDAWYFERTDEIRVQRGVDVLEANRPGTVVRDPNPATWLPGVADSGPIILLVREYGNYRWTRTSGIDYDWNIRLPATDYGKFSVKLQGTYTNRYDRLVLDGAQVERLVGTSTIDIPKSRASLTLRWDGGDAWNAFVRHNHADPISTTASAACLTAANPTVTQRLRREAGYCKVGRERTVDLGVTYKGIKGLSVSATVFNVANDYNRTDGFPGAFTYWDPGLQGHLGRRISVGANYTFW